MENQTMDSNQDEPKLQPKDAFVINDDLDFNAFINKIDYFADNKIQVAIDPSITTETIFATLREYNYFGVLNYDPNKFSHRILNVMPQMTTVAHEYEEKSEFEKFLEERDKQSENQNITTDK